jgi:hypothetical protein
MSARYVPVAIAVVLLALAACDERPPGRDPTEPTPDVSRTLSVTPETGRLEGVARRLATALRDPDFRARLYARLKASPYPEGKIHLQRTFVGPDRLELRAMARLNQESEAAEDSVVRTAQALEIYLPVPAHRAEWKGGTHLLVATQARDGDLPVAYDLAGGRHFLDPTRPPQTPVLAVVPVETNFDLPPVRPQAQCMPDQSCGGAGGGAIVAPPGLYMTKAHFTSDFEGWLKGNPEFEVHILGQRGATDSLTKYECAGEHQPAPYNWNGNTDWNGNVLLFSQAQIDAYHAAHPGETFRIVALEDDDTSCEMKVDQDRWKTFIGSIGPLYKDITGATDSGTVRKYIAAGRSLRKFLSALASLIKTNDDLIGNAMEDKVVGEFHTGFNWVLRADGNVTNGWINLEMH